MSRRTAATPPPSPPATADDIEAQFYEALQRGDLERVMAAWSDDEDISCVHPGGARLVGPEPIRASFAAIFRNGPIDARPEQVRRLQSHACAVHAVLERVQASGEEGVQVAWVLATNVYVRGAQGWRLVAHHASPANAANLSELPEAGSTLH
jgi:uncharacterized protein (TIGR02246 family)